MKKIMLTIIAAFMLQGCASGYSTYYKSNPKANVGMGLEMLKDGETPILVKTGNPKDEYARYLAKNFYGIGRASFNGKMESDENIIEQAKTVKATLVLSYAKFVTTLGNSMPLVLPNGPGAVSVTPMYNQHMRYDQAAMFLVKRTYKMRVGVYLDDLTPEIKIQYERNTGAMIFVTVEGTPAFEANIIPGDVLISIDSKSVRDSDHALQLLTEIPLASDKVVFKILRKNLERDIIIPLPKGEAVPLIGTGV